MIIDLILDRKDGINTEVRGGKLYTLKEYSARSFYNNVMNYYSVFPEIVKPIATALNGGEELDVKRELIRYILDNDYNPEIVNFIRSVDWLE
jgi:hypothetical protein